MNSTPNLAADLQRALALHNQGQVDAAAAIYRAILGQQPLHFDALHLLGVVHLQQGDNAEGARLIGAAVAVNPGHGPALSNLGVALRNQDKFEEALDAFDRAVRAQPASAENHFNRGLSLIDLSRFEEALAAFDRTVAIKPDHADAHQGRSSALERLGHFEDSIAAADTSLRLRPNHPAALYNRAKSLYNLGRTAESAAFYAQAIALQPDFAQAHWGLAETLLLAGDMTRGWQEYEWRWKSKLPTGAAGETMAPLERSFPFPRWTGEDLSGRTILLHAEQGYGDTIHFGRYVAAVAERGARVVLEVQPPLKRLLAGLKGVAEVVARGEALPTADVHCPLMSLPLTLGRPDDRMTNAVPYIAAPQTLATAWRTRVAGDGRSLVGLVWYGARDRVKERHRSIPPAALASLGDIDATFVSLQLDIRAEDRETPFFKDRVRQFTLNDFADTAALIGALDLVISVDTANAHLAGAMGKPVWILLSSVADWRWGLAGLETSWYPTARLFRQSPHEAWEPVIGRVREALRAFESDSPP